MTTNGFRDHVGLRSDAADGDRSVVVLDADDRHTNPHGTVHGGAVATLIDVAMGEAVAAGTNGERPVTIELKVTYLEAAKPGRITATAHVRRRGSRITIVETEVTDTDDAMVAHGIGTFTTVE